MPRARHVKDDALAPVPRDPRGAARTAREVGDGHPVDRLLHDRGAPGVERLRAHRRKRRVAVAHAALPVDHEGAGQRPHVGQHAASAPS